MKPFIQQLDELMQKDRQKFSLSATKIGQDLVLQIAPDITGTGKIVDITIPAQDINLEEIDTMVMKEVFNVMVVPAKAEMASSVTEVKPQKEEEEEEEKEESAPTQGKPEKEKPAKKAAAKKQSKKMPGPAKLVLKEVPATPEPQIYDSEKHEDNSNQEAREIAQEVMQDNGMKPEPAQTTMSVEELKNLGDVKFTERKYEESLDLYKQCLAAEPDNETFKALVKKGQQWVDAINRLKK